jgi:hypothetical protein
MTLQFPGERCSKVSLILLRNRVKFLRRSLTSLTSLRRSIFRKRLGASRLRSLTLTAYAALTRPARSRVIGNYRSDGEIQRTICAKPAGAFSPDPRDYSPVS